MEKRDLKTTTRYRNVRLLCKDLALKAGSKGKGLQELADALGRTLGQVSNFAGDNPTRGIGNKVASDIENVLGLAPGWLDVEHSSPLAKAMAGSASPSAPLTRQPSTGHSPVVNTIMEKLLQLEKAGKDAELAAINAFVDRVKG